MSTATAEPVGQEEIPEPIPKRSDIAKGIRTVYLNRVAHMGMMLEKVSRQIRRAERYEKFAATGDPKDLETPEGEDDEVAVYIGNEFHSHDDHSETSPMPSQQAPTDTASPAAPPPPPPAPSAPAPSPSTSTSSKTEVIREKMVGYLGPALLTGGALLVGAAGTAAYNWYFDKPEHVTNIQAPDVPPTPETNWRIGLEVEDYP